MPENEFPREQEVVIFAVYMIKQVLYGFDRLDQILDHVGPASPMMAFYLNGIYSLLTAMFLLDKGRDKRGGIFYKEFKPLGLADSLNGVWGVMDMPITNGTFGELLLAFRNKAFVHGTLSDKDISRVGEKVGGQVDLNDPKQYLEFQQGLHSLWEVLKYLPLELCKRVGINPKDIGYIGP